MAPSPMNASTKNEDRGVVLQNFDKAYGESLESTVQNKLRYRLWVPGRH